MKSNKYVKLYSLLGMILCGASGGITGFLFGGIPMTIPGVFTGILFAYFMRKMIIK